LTRQFRNERGFVHGRAERLARLHGRQFLAAGQPLEADFQASSLSGRFRKQPSKQLDR